MKKLFIFLMLVSGIQAELCAQSKTKADEVFGIPNHIIVNRRFFIDLGKGNKLTVELTDITDLGAILNLDSLLRVFVKDIATLKDSLTDPRTAKRIDYVTDDQGRKKIRLQQFAPKGAGYLINEGSLASLKVEQDTLNITGVVVNPPPPEDMTNKKRPRYYHLEFRLNDYEELESLIDGRLNGKMATISQDLHKKWPHIPGGSSHAMITDRSIFADKSKGFTAESPSDYITGIVTINIQNYKSYFVPSVSLGLRLSISNRDRTFKWEPGLSWEPHFFFAKNAQGRLKTFRNDFLTLTYGQGGIRDHNPHKDFAFSAVFSIGYLVHRDGEFIEKNTFRLGAGRLQLLKTTIEPSIYFDRFFKGVTPGIRISQAF